MYALKPMPDPKTIRYPSASHDRIEIAPRCRPPNSPANKPAIRRITPPVRLCIATPSIAELGIPPCFEWSEPQAHASEATTRTAAMPEGTVCSAQLTPPLPTNSSRVPVMTAATQLARVGLIPVFPRRIGKEEYP